MSKYYFLTGTFPEIRIGVKPDMSFHELVHLLEENLYPSDLEKSRVIRRFFDLQNMRDFWLEKELDPYGNFDFSQIEDAMFMQLGFPDYVYHFLENYTEKNARLRHFPELLSLYFREEIPKAKGFLKTYLTFEHDWRLVMAALRAKKLGRDIALELQYEDPEDPLVAQILAQKDAKSYQPPDEFEELKPIFDMYQDDAVALNQALYEYRFNKIDLFLGVDLFSIDRVLGFEAQLILVERWLEMDRQKGIEIVKSIVGAVNK